jgi:hypothetical protein
MDGSFFSIFKYSVVILNDLRSSEYRTHVLLVAEWSRRNENGLEVPGFEKRRLGDQKT